MFCSTGCDIGKPCCYFSVGHSDSVIFPCHCCCGLAFIVEIFHKLYFVFVGNFYYFTFRFGSFTSSYRLLNCDCFAICAFAHPVCILNHPAPVQVHFGVPLPFHPPAVTGRFANKSESHLLEELILLSALPFFSPSGMCRLPFSSTIQPRHLIPFPTYFPIRGKFCSV